MKKKDIYKIINEEISGFDFLNSKIQEQEEETIRTLSDENFQKEFIIDSITRMREKIKIIDTGDMYLTKPDSDFNDDTDKLDLAYFLTVKYNYQGKDLEFSMYFQADDLIVHYDNYSEPGDRYQPSEREKWISNFPWDRIDVDIFTVHDEKIEFSGIDKASDKTKELFIRSFLEDLIKNEIDNVDIKDQKPRFTSF